MIEMPAKIIVATKNKGKLREVREVLAGLPIALVSLRDYASIPDVIEDGLTFAENALKKAKAVFEATGIPALADDSGLCVDALDGRPGVLSARYAGEGASDESNYSKVLKEMKDVPEGMRSAHFVCVLALVKARGYEKVFEATCVGKITTRPVGMNGFGYDPIFYFEPLKSTFAEIDSSAKSMVSHRGKALRQLARYLRGCNRLRHS